MAKRSAHPVQVKQSEPPIPEEILAEAIVKVSNGFDAAMRAGLTRQAICVLVKAKTGIPASTIGKVLDALPELRKTYTTL